MLSEQLQPAPQPRPHGKPWRYSEAAAFLNVTERTLYRWQKTGRLQPITICGKIYLPDSVVRGIAEHGDDYLDSLEESNQGENVLKIAGAE